MDKLLSLQRDFINLRLGTFIHFNSATVQFHTGETVDWEMDVENQAHPRRFPFREAEWAPTELDCRQWARAAKAAGCRFAALTAKHHEGFALWPTAWSEHCVRNAAVQTDVVAAYLEAFRAEGIAAGLYFSTLDLTAGIGQRSCTPAQKELIKGQITELLTNYGSIPFLIVDGWNAPWGGPTEQMLSFQEIDRLVKSLQPDCLLINIGCTSGISGTDVVCFENGAGQDITPGFQGPGALCQKFTGSWFWRSTDAATPTASPAWAADLLARCAAHNVSLIMNLSPNPQGRLEENLEASFAALGELVTLPAPVTDLPAAWLRRS